MKLHEIKDDLDDMMDKHKPGQYQKELLATIRKDRKWYDRMSNPAQQELMKILGPKAKKFFADRPNHFVERIDDKEFELAIMDIDDEDEGVTVWYAYIDKDGGENDHVGADFDKTSAASDAKAILEWFDDKKDSDNEAP